MRDMKTRLLEVEDSNVIIVDWSASATLPLTNTRVSNARVIGHQVAKILEDLHVSWSICLLIAPRLSVYPFDQPVARVLVSEQARAQAQLSESYE